MAKRVHALKVPEWITGKIPDAIRSGSWYERDMLDYINSLGLEGYYVDAGANVGNHSAYFATSTKATHVFSFEPAAHNIARCVEFLNLNGLLPKVTVFPVAGASTRGIIEFDMQINREQNWKIRAASARLDDVLPPGVVLIKIDVEGAEVDLLKGCHRILSEDQPRLFVEALDEDELRAIMEVLTPYGYRRTGRVFNHSPTYEIAVI